MSEEKKTLLGIMTKAADAPRVEHTALKDSGAREEFATGSRRDTQEGKGRYDLLPMYALFRLALVYEKGAKKYDDENWRKGQPLRRTMSSAMRHLMKHMQGYRDEDHLAQAMWNIAAAIETEEMIRLGLLPATLNDMPDWVTPAGERGGAK